MRIRGPAILAIAAGVAMAAPSSALAGIGEFNGVSYYSASSETLAAAATDSALVLCGSDENPTGGGQKSGTSASLWHTIASFVATHPGGWKAQVSNDTGPDMTFDVFVACRTKTIASRTSYNTKGPGSGNSMKLKSACRSDEHVLSGSFASIDGEDFPNSYLFASYPYDGSDGNSKPDDGWKVKIYNAGGPRIDNPRLNARCVRGGTQPKYRTLSAGFAGAGDPAIDPECLDGEAVMGGGAKISGSSADSYMASTFPHDSGDIDDAIPENGWTTVMHTDQVGTFSLTGYAICKPA